MLKQMYMLCDLEAMVPFWKLHNSHSVVEEIRLWKSRAATCADFQENVFFSLSIRFAFLQSLYLGIVLVGRLCLTEVFTGGAALFLGQLGLSCDEAEGTGSSSVYDSSLGGICTRST